MVIMTAEMAIPMETEANHAGKEEMVITIGEDVTKEVKERAKGARAKEVKALLLRQLLPLPQQHPRLLCSQLLDHQPDRPLDPRLNQPTTQPEHQPHRQQTLLRQRRFSQP